MPLPVRHTRRLLLALLLPFAVLGGAVAAGRIELRLAAPAGCADVLPAEVAAACAAPTASLAVLLAGALVAALLVAYATVSLTRLRA